MIDSHTAALIAATLTLIWAVASVMVDDFSTTKEIKNKTTLCCMLIFAWITFYLCWYFIIRLVLIGVTK